MLNKIVTFILELIVIAAFIAEIIIIFSVGH